MTTLSGYLEEITFYNPENGYLVARIRVESTGRPVTAVGHATGIHAGELLRLTGAWRTHPRYGEQFRFEALESRLPADVDGIREYLGSGLIPGMGQKTAQRLVDRFQERTMDVLDRSPEALLEVPGIGRATMERIVSAWNDHRVLREIMTFLRENGIRLSHAAKIFSLYGAAAVETLSRDPFRLAADLPGTGFVIADAIARNMGAAENDPTRIEACLGHLMDRWVADGHVYAPEDRLLEKCRSLFGIPTEVAATVLNELAGDGTLHRETAEAPDTTAAIYLTEMYEAEQGLADRLRILQSVPAGRMAPDGEVAAAQVLKRLSIRLSDAQQWVLDQMLGFKVAILTGGPGTGKTTLIRAITAAYESVGATVALAAPTGRAARRLTAVTNRPAATLHRLLAYSPGEGIFRKDRDDPVDADVIVVDEAAMVDTVLMYRLVEAVPAASALVLVGDAFQLPPVGPGAVLSELIASGAVPTFELSEVFRQAAESPIIMNAHRVRRGEPPELIAASSPLDPAAEFVFVETDSIETAAETVIRLCAVDIPAAFCLDPIRDVQVLTPMHKGEVGTIQLNRVLQDRLNPNPVSATVHGNRFKVDDKVIHLKNNYAKDVFNGDIGRITEIDGIRKTLVVSYDERIVTYLFDELGELAPAYAITVHKAQGSEYPAVVVPLVTQHFVMLQRNLFYTAMTRGRQLVILVGSRKAVRVAMNNDNPMKRLSKLAQRLVSVES